MTDPLPPEEEAGEPPTPEEFLELGASAHDVAFVVPAPAYQAIDTEHELARPEGPPAGTPGAGPEPLANHAIAALGAALGEKIDALRTLFDREIRAESTREKVVDRLHAELQEYKQDLLLNVMRPVFVDLIQLHDDIGKITEAQADGEGDVRRLLDLMRGFQQGIEDILYRQGVEPYSQDGDAFDPRRQRAVATVPTDDPAANKRIAARHRKGFQAGERVIRPEVVSVYALKK